MYGLVIADKNEFEPVVNYAKQCGCYSLGAFRGFDCVEFCVGEGKRIKAVFCGIGKVNAASAAAFLIGDGAEMILNIGLSGGLTHFGHDTIIIGSGSFEADFDLTKLGYAEFEKPWQEYIYKADENVISAAKRALPDAVVGMLACGDLFLTDAERGRYLNEKYGVAAFDMETGAIASVCSKSGVKYLILRQVSDSADENAAEEYKGNNEQSKPDLLKSLLSCISYLE